jgi:nitrite reductase/ring-hydroxylating ferredoxin subunit
MPNSHPGFVRAARLADLPRGSSVAVQIEDHTLALFRQGDAVYAVDNRCPHMGFPLERGTVQDGILTCHWHHARFDLVSGGTFDLWAGDLHRYPSEVRDGEVWVDLTPATNALTYQQRRLQDGLERNIPLVLAKALIAQLDGGVSPAEPFRVGLEFGVRYRQAGWGKGLTILTCLTSLLPVLDPDARPRALYNGLSAVARDCDGAPPRFVVQPLPGSTPSYPTLKRWFRRFVEVRDAEGAERCLVSAVRAGTDTAQLADMLFAAATDHRYIQGGHVLDFTNKACEALDLAGWQLAEPVLSSLAPGYAAASRMEESNAWRHPVDLVAMLERAFAALPTAYARSRREANGGPSRAALADILLGDDPQMIVDTLLGALRDGYPVVELGAAVVYAAALRIARFHVSNEFSDWDTALHTFTFANAVHQGLRRAPSAELVRGLFDAAMSVYLDRFLNVPAARLPVGQTGSTRPEELLEALPVLLDRQQQVNQASETVAHYLYAGGDVRRLMANLGDLLLREDRDFHTIQTLEASYRQVGLADAPGALAPDGVNVLVAATRYLAAHAPTVRAQGQTYQIARRLQRGEQLFVEDGQAGG